MELARELVADVFHTVPRFRGRGRILRLLNTIFNRAGFSPVVSARMRSHRLRVDLRAQTEFLAYYTGEYDSHEIRGLSRLFEPGSHVLDVGANIGFYSVPFALALKALGGRLHAFEPLPANVERLRENLRLNDLDGNVTVREIALSNRAGSAEITLREDFVNGSGTGNAAILIEDGRDAGFKRVTIRTETLDNLLRDAADIGRIDLIKVDIEGHEDLFFEGGLETIRRHRPIILAEMNGDYFARRGVDMDRRTQELLQGMDYRTLGSLRPGFGPWRPILTLAGRGGSDDVMLVPAEKIERALMAMNAT